VALILTGYRLLDALVVFQCMAYSHVDELPCKTDGTFITSCLVAAFFDVRAIMMLLSQVFCIQHPWKRKALKVVVDLHPDRGFMRIGSNTIPLSEVSDIKRETSLFYWLLSMLYMLAGLPMALGSLTISSFDLLAGLEVCVPILGCVAILREIFGPSLFVKLYLSFRWILAFKQQDRDELGRSVLRNGLPQQFMAGSILLPVVWFSLLSRRIDDVSVGDNFILFLLCAFFGGLFGLLLGIMHGLPVIPEAKLTGWPSVCCSISFYNRAHCPCLFSCTYCGEIHSRQVLIVIAPDDMYSFKRMLQGNLSKMPSR